MTGISTRGIYGLEALYYIGLNSHQQPINIGQIAKHCEIPQNYLEQILASLNQKGFLKSIRGPKGGYILARPPEEINIYEVLMHLENSALLLGKAHKQKGLGIFWQEINHSLVQILSLNLGQLLAYELKAHNDDMYFI